MEEENCFIESLVATPIQDTQRVMEKYASVYGEDLKDTVTGKTKEQDGWIFSNNWKHTMTALMSDEARLWTIALNDAMNGWGTDENTLLTLVCTMPERLRNSIFKLTWEMYQKNLLDRIKAECSGNFKKVMVYQSMSPEDCRAQVLYDAMNGMGTDEAQLIRVIGQCDIGERKNIIKAYERMFQRDLIEHVRSETGGRWEADFSHSLIAMLEAEIEPFDVVEDTKKIKEAFDGWGNDKDALIRLICRKTPNQMALIRKEYADNYGNGTLNSLTERIESEISSMTHGNFKEVMLGCTRKPIDNLCENVRWCMKGFGTCDTGLITLLVHMPDFKKAALMYRYQMKFNRSLIDDIKSDSSEDYEKTLLALVRPAPEVWADALKGTMKGLGTSDNLLINFMCIAKDDMGEVRTAFKKLYPDSSLAKWIDGDCGQGDYKKTLIFCATRDTTNDPQMLPQYWAQRCRDAAHDVDTLKDILVQYPSVAIKRGTVVFKAVWGKDMKTNLISKCKEEHGTYYIFTDWWKHTMLSLLDMPVERYVKGLHDAMQGFGTDEYALTGLVCTMPPNMYNDIHKLYEKTYGKSLLKHIESETSFSYKQVLVAQAYSLHQSRAYQLNKAMGRSWDGTDEKMLIFVIILSSHKERSMIQEAYEQMYGRGLIEHIESETSGSLKNILIAILESSNRDKAPNYEDDVEQMFDAIEGRNQDEDCMIRVLASKSHDQIDQFKQKFAEMKGFDLLERVSDKSFSWGESIFGQSSSFKSSVELMLRDKEHQLAYAVQACIKGWGTYNAGLITCCVHLPEVKRVQLRKAYAEIEDGGDLYEHIAGDTSGDFKQALLALVKPAPEVMAEALTSSMKGLGTSDNLFINWMFIAKERMDEVREAFQAKNGKTLAEWIDGDCGNSDYKDTLMRLANRECLKFPGSDVMCTIPPPPKGSGEKGLKAVVRKFNVVFNELCAAKRANEGDELDMTEDQAQEMAGVFSYFGQTSSLKPNLDRQAVWDLTCACGKDVGFCPQNDGEDLDATFDEWNYSGTGEICWNDFVQEMTVRVNDPNHYNAEPLPED